MNQTELAEFLDELIDYTMEQLPPDPTAGDYAGMRALGKLKKRVLEDEMFVTWLNEEAKPGQE